MSRWQKTLLVTTTVLLPITLLTWLVTNHRTGWPYLISISLVTGACAAAATYALGGRPSMSDETAFEFWLCGTCGEELGSRGEALRHAASQHHSITLTERPTPAGVAPEPTPPEPVASPAEPEPVAPASQRPYESLADPPATREQTEAFRRGDPGVWTVPHPEAPLQRMYKTPWGITRKNGIIREVDLIDWTIRTAFLIIGLVLGYLLGTHI